MPLSLTTTQLDSFCERGSPDYLEDTRVARNGEVTYLLVRVRSETSRRSKNVGLLTMAVMGL